MRVLLRFSKLKQNKHISMWSYVKYRSISITNQIESSSLSMKVVPSFSTFYSTNKLCKLIISRCCVLTQVHTQNTIHSLYTINCFIQQNKLMFLSVNMVSFDVQLWQVGIGVQKIRYMSLLGSL